MPNPCPLALPLKESADGFNIDDATGRHLLDCGECTDDEFNEILRRVNAYDQMRDAIIMWADAQILGVYDFKQKYNRPEQADFRTWEVLAAEALTSALAAASRPAAKEETNG